MYSSALATSNTATGSNGIHGVNIQIAGFQWLPNIPADALGSRFESMNFRNEEVTAKLARDWRLDNACRLFSEVAPYNGGRQLTLRSVFQVQNRTGHPILMAVHPDPSHKPFFPLGKLATHGIRKKKGKHGSSSSSRRRSSRNNQSGYDHEDSGFDPTTDFHRVESGDKYHVPFLLLEEALRNVKGNHLGSIWVRPDRNVDDDNESEAETLFDSLKNPGSGEKTTSENCAIRFSSKPVQLARIVHETSEIFVRRQEAGEDEHSAVTGTGMQISCPVIHRKQGVSVAPFCYCLEVKRTALRKLTKKKGPSKASIANMSSRDLLMHQIKKTNARRGSVGMFDGKFAEVEAFSDSDDDSSDAYDGGGGKKSKRKMSLSGSSGDASSSSKKKDSKTVTKHKPCAYTLIIHPPIVIENLLPEGGTFELIHRYERASAAPPLVVSSTHPPPQLNSTGTRRSCSGGTTWRAARACPCTPWGSMPPSCSTSTSASAGRPRSRRARSSTTASSTGARRRARTRARRRMRLCSRASSGKS